MTFDQFAEGHGLLIRDLRDDGRIHRCPTATHPRSDNGSYFCEHERGWIINWEGGDRAIWWQDANAKPWTAEEKAQAEQRQRQAQRERAQKAAQAGATARFMLGEAELLIPRPAVRWRAGRQAADAIPAHPYLVRKGFPEESGLVRDGVLLIPMFAAGNYGAVIGVQRISEDGTKLFLPGQRARGAVHRFGSGQREVWLVEGYATGLTARAALKRLYRAADVVVCFSAGNLTHVAGLGIGTHVMADNDASHAGEDAARATGLPYLVPGEVGTDANDLMCARGLEAVIALFMT